MSLDTLGYSTEAGAMQAHVLAQHVALIAQLNALIAQVEETQQGGAQVQTAPSIYIPSNLDLDQSGVSE